MLCAPSLGGLCFFGAAHAEVGGGRQENQEGEGGKRKQKERRGGKGKKKARGTNHTKTHHCNGNADQGALARQ